MGISLYSSAGIEGSVYYLVHDMIIKAALFFLVGALVVAAGTDDLRKMGGLITRYPVLGWLFFIGSLVLAGVPPFSGFIGKILLLRGSLEQEEILLTVAALITSLLILYSMIRIFVRGFWGDTVEGLPEGQNKKVRHLTIPAAVLLAISIFIGIGAEFIYPHVETIANMLLDRAEYINAVLRE